MCSRMRGLNQWLTDCSVTRAPAILTVCVDDKQLLHPCIWYGRSQWAFACDGEAVTQDLADSVHLSLTVPCTWAFAIS